jgi:hypothetical protein
MWLRPGIIGSGAAASGGSITAASIESNGWVLAVTLTGTLSSTSIVDAGGTNFASYALAPNAVSPAMKLALSANGFTQSGGVVIPSSSVARTLIATKALRKATVATASGTRNAKTPDEVDNGNGTITVRVALSEHVYFGETGLSLTTLAGWRTGATTQTIAVTNNSRIGSGDTNIIALPSPIVRWADVPYQRLVSTTLIPLEVVAFSHHPNGFAPIPGVKFTVTDGTNTAFAWATALVSSPKYGSGGTGVATKVFRAVVDGSTATPGALTEGLVRCDFKAFPWIGQARSSNTADTALSVVASNGAPSMTNLATTGMAPAAQIPFVYAYDPTNTWTPTLYIYVEPNTWVGTGSITSNVLTVATTTSGAVAIGTKISGVGTTPGCTVVSGSAPTWTVTTTANVGTIALQGGGTSNNNIATVSSNPATAAAGICCAAVDTARNAIVVQARTTGARNGQPSLGPKASDGIIVRIKAGTYANLGTTGVSSGISTSYSWDIIEGDPADSNPRVNVIQNIPVTAPSLRLSRVNVRNLFLSGTSGSGPPLSTTYGWADNVEINGSVQSNNTTIFNTGATNTFWTNTKYWKFSTYLGGQLARNCQVENVISSITALNNARLSGSFVGSAGIGSPGSAVDPLGATQDIIAVGNDLRYISGARPWACGTTSAASAGSTALGTSGYAVFNRQVFANNVCEMYGVSNPLFNAIGENGSTVATFSIVEGNTAIGDRTNWLYDDLNLATIAANDTESNIILCNRVANNVFDQHSIKHDSFNDPTVASGDPASKTSGRIGVALGTSFTRSWAVTVGSELVIAGSPAKVYRCSQAGTTASTSGPTGTGTGIVDGSAKWDYFGTENRQHGYRPQAVRGWSALYGVGMLDNIILRGNTNAEFLHEFEGLNTPNYTVDTGSDGVPNFTLDKSGSTTAGPRYNAGNTGGGNYKPLSGSPLAAHSRAANINIDSAGNVRSGLFATGAIEL